MAKKSLPKFRFSLDRKLTLPIFIITAAAAIFLRFKQIIENTDLDTGIYLNRDFRVDYPVFVIAGGLFLILLILILGSSKDKMAGAALLINPMRLPIDKLNKNFRIASGTGILVTAGTMFFQIYMDISYIVRVNSLYNADFEDEDLHISLLTGMDGADIASYILMIIGGITCITIGANMIKGDGLSKLNCFFLLFVVLWKVVQIFDVFFTAQEETRIINLYSEKLYIIFSDICLIFLLLAVIRVFEGFEEKRTRLGLIFWGYASTLITAVSAITPLICLIYLPYDGTGNLQIPSIADFGIIIMSFILVMPFFTNFSYREMSKMTYREGRRDHWISKLAVNESEMEGISVESLDDEKQKKTNENKKSSNIDELF
jgi:hypothetical protein